MKTGQIGKVPPEHVRTKRAYEPAAPGDGVRILIDRLWPRGITKEDLVIDQWNKELAPSTALRQWFGHDPALWDEFARRYAAELQSHAEPLEALRALARQGTVTLVYGAHDAVHNNAAALRAVLLALPEKPPSVASA